MKYKEKGKSRKLTKEETFAACESSILKLDAALDGDGDTQPLYGYGHTEHRLRMKSFCLLE